MNEIDIRAFPRRIVLESRRNLVLSVVLTAGVLTFELALRASFVVHGFVVAIGLFLVGYHLVRMRRARAADSTLEAARAFVIQQRRSHLVRGRLALVLFPLLLAATWGLALAAPHQLNAVGWALLALMSAFLVRGWFAWYRTLREVKLYACTAVRRRRNRGRRAGMIVTNLGGGFEGCR